MRREPYDLDVSATDGAGDAFKVEDFLHQTVIMRPGGLVGTVPKCTLQLQVSNSTSVADQFVNYGAATVAGADTPMTMELEAWMYVRVVTSSALLGATPSATWCGDNSRTS